MRIFGFILILILGVANLVSSHYSTLRFVIPMRLNEVDVDDAWQTIDRRLPPVNVKGGLFNWAALKNPAYSVYCISGVTSFLGLYTGGFDVSGFSLS